MIVQLTLVEMLFTAIVAFGLGWAVAGRYPWPLARGLAGLLIAVLAATLLGVRPDVGVIGGMMMGTGFIFRRGLFA